MSKKVLLDARAAASTYIVFGLMFGPVCIFAALAFRQYSLTIIVTAVLLVIFIWIRAFRIVVDDTTVSYTSLFSGRRSFQLAEIVSARTEIGVKKPIEPTYRLIIVFKESGVASQIVVNMKVFRRRDIAKLIDVLGIKLEGHPRLSVLGSQRR